ncbi:MAG: bile acid:sodium symporter family protein [Opitutales bacterium]|nr:bile acid:sodium symporter family protein [Opitutales bacterium]
METDIVTALFLPLALAFIMMGMGLTLSLKDFSRVLRYPRAASLGLANQLILLPLIGFAVASAFTLRPELAVGIMVLAACPGGPTSNMISFLCRGDVALSISLTAVSSVAAVITVPIVVNLALFHFMAVDEATRLPVWDAVFKILLITLVPTFIGMLIRYRWPQVTRKSLGWVQAASIVLFITVLLGAIFSQKESLPAFFREVGWAMLALNVATMVVGFLSARLFLLNIRQGYTITLETGLQNGTLAITIAASPILLGNPTMAIAPAIYSLIMFMTATVMILLSRTRVGPDPLPVAR